VARVVATLKTRHDIEAVGKEVYNLAFPFVTPLGAQYDHITHLS
jgi:hypothetical protein